MKKNYRVHLLGYNIKDIDKLEAYVNITLEKRHNNTLRQIEILKDNGFEIDINKLRKADGKYIYKQHLMHYLVETGQVSEMFGDFYYKTFKNNGICHFDIKYPSPYEAIKVIKECGGIAVLAHSGQQQNFELIPELVKLGLDGLELNHKANSDKDKEIIREYADKYNLVLTGGSDCHGLFEAGSPEVGDYLSEESGVKLIIG
ncbi:MAG: hypothetical protein Q4D13_06060 [Erysipelotrichaceae bacterium]|nr:hypothetical protein [Erysipelotrichaceae bacterium]